MAVAVGVSKDTEVVLLQRNAFGAVQVHRSNDLLLLGGYRLSDVVRDEALPPSPNQSFDVDMLVQHRKKCKFIITTMQTFKCSGVHGMDCALVQTFARLSS